jgi:hypothetical protein
VEFSEFESFRTELRALSDSIDRIKAKTLREELLRERFRTLFRIWASNVEPGIKNHLKNPRDLFKLSAEIEKLAQLASKAKQIADYRKHLRNAIQLANSLVIYLPASDAASSVIDHKDSKKNALFISGIPDLPLTLVPNPIFGWRSRLETFVREHPFEKSVFIMIRYRERNRSIIEALKNSLNDKGFFGVLAADHNLTDDLYNPVACLLCCSRGIAVFDRAERHEYFNPNVAYELGMLHLLNRPCLLLKHQSLKTLQTDILMKLYTPYANAAGLARLVASWIPNS